MSFTIIIEETKKVEGLTDRRWVEGGPDGKSEDGTRGYTPQIPEIKLVTQQVFKQTIEELNIADVIKAVNGI